MEIRIHAHGKLREWARGGDRGHSPQKLSTRSRAHLLPRPRSDGCDEATAPGPRPEAAGPLNAPGLTPVLLASLRAPHQPACRRGGRARNSNSPWGPGRLDRLAPIPPGPFLGLFLPTVPLCQVRSLSPGSSHSFPLYIIFSCPSSVSLHHIRYCPYFHPVCRSRKGISTANHSRSLTPTTTTPRSIDPAASSHRAPVQRQRKRPSRPA